MENRETYIPNLNTFADLVDRLIVEVNKLAFFENKKREEHAKDAPDNDLIAHWDNLSRDCCEYRSRLKDAINQTLKQIMEGNRYLVLREVRTFRAPPLTVGELLAQMCENTANLALKGELVESFKHTWKEMEKKRIAERKDLA